MSVDKLRIVKTRNVKTPARAHRWDAGIDFFMPEDMTDGEMNKMAETTGQHLTYSKTKEGFVDTITIAPGESVLIPTGIKVLVPEGYVMNFENKSGIASKKHLVFGSKVVDCGYEGVVHVNLHNVGTFSAFIKAGDKIAQALTYAIETPSIEVVESEEKLYGDSRSERGEGGFGSTDAK